MNAKLNLLIAGLLSVAAHLELNRASAQTIEYAVIDLGTLGGDSSVAYDINDIGQVVGASQFSPRSETFHAFLHSNGSMQDLGTLRDNYNDYSSALGINDNGQVVGVSQFSPSTTEVFHAFLYSNGAMQDIGTLGGPWGRARAINNRGDIVGESSFNREPMGGYYSNHAFLYSNGAMQDLGTLGGIYQTSIAYAINNHGQVVGMSQIAGGAEHAFLYSNGSMQDLGTLKGGYSSHALGINDIGLVVGYSSVSSDWSNTRFHAFLYSNDAMQDLGTLKGDYSSRALGINDIGQVVGESWTGGNYRTRRAFLYSNGSMRNLNNLIDPASKWTLAEARAINNIGQIVSTGRNPAGKWRAFLLNPLPPGWKKVIAETTPPQPTYSDGPEKLPGKDSLVVVTHGRIRKENWQTTSPNPDWVDDIVNAIRKNLEVRGLQNWQVEAYKWTEKAWMKFTDVLGGTLLDNADKEGVNLGNRLKNQDWKHIHLISHSAGAAVIQTASLLIKESDIATTIHTTFLDAYVGFTYGGRKKYGLASDWSDSYFARDPETADSLFSRTEGHLDYAYGVDITWLEPNKKTISVYSSGNGITGNLPCLYTVTTHEWPHEFYLKTITQETVIGAEGFGFPLSKEGGGWDLAIKNYVVEANSSYIRVLGQPDADCASLGGNSVPTYSSPTMDFNKVQTIPSATGTIVKNGNGLIITSSRRLQQQSLQRVRKNAAATSEPAWVAASINVTNTVNSISFDAQFLSVNAEGLLTTYWQTNTVGSIDERVVLSGLQRYTYAFSTAVTNSVYTLGFRLDSFSGAVSSVVITNVSFGFIGLKESFSLVTRGADTNGTQNFSLTGPSGYNYRIESSTNLVDWSTIAVLVNTNGVVNFSDPSFTKNTNRRFYRAVVP